MIDDINAIRAIKEKGIVPKFLQSFSRDSAMLNLSIYVLDFLLIFGTTKRLSYILSIDLVQ